MAPLYIFYNGPYANQFNSDRWSYYGLFSTPTTILDGQIIANNPWGYAAAINNRLNVPCYIDFDINMVGNASGGTGYYSVTAEQDPGVSGPIKVWSLVIQDNVTTDTDAWGGYEGMELMWLPVAWPLGTKGQVIDFTGPYPQTVHVTGQYTLNQPLHSFEDLRVVTWVQLASSTREVLNAAYMDLPDTAVGVCENTATATGGNTYLSVWPNPTSGSFFVATMLPEHQTGTVSVFDVSGRLVDSFPAENTAGVSVHTAGIYFVRIVTSDGQTAGARVAVVR